jgi:spore coat polysaccharide biosynthesis protein SpsF
MSQGVVTIVQARTGSTRLPNKVLLSLCGKPLLLRLLERVGLSNLKGKIVVATSELPEDDTIEKLCLDNKIDCFRGSPADLLDRHYKTGLAYDSEAVVKIPSDCPLIDPHIIDKVISFYLENYPAYDYVSNLHPATYPDGNDVEIISMDSLKKAWENATRDLEREHTTPYIWENKRIFSIGNVEWETGLDYSSNYRFTIDYEEDYIFIRSIYEELYEKKPSFTLYDILNLLIDKPYLRRINQKYLGKYWYENHLNELKNIDEYKKKLNESDG